MIKVKKKIFIYGVGFLSVTTILIMSGIMVNQINNYDDTNAISYVDEEDEYDYDKHIEKYKTSYDEEIFDESETVNMDTIKASYYIAGIKDDDEVGAIMLQITTAPEKYPDGSTTYYYRNVFEDDYKVYSSTYIYQSNEFLNNTGYRITNATALDEILYNDNNVKESYSKKELYEILEKYRDNKKLSDDNAIVKAYQH